MKIVSLKAENVKRLVSVEITPDGHTVTIGGNNGAGKSSVLDAIAYALGGQKLVPPEPIRDGQTEATITVDLGEYVVTRTFIREELRTPAVVNEGTPEERSGFVKSFGPVRSYLTVKNKEGAKYPSPQALLDRMLGELSFDPLAFANADPKAQAETLRGVAGIDTSDLDSSAEKLSAERTIVGRDLKALEARLAGSPRYENAPVEAISAASVAADLQTATDKHHAVGVKASQLAQAERDLAADENSFKSYTEKANRLAAELAEVQNLANAYRERVATSKVNVLTARNEYESAKAEVPDTSALKARLVEVEQINKRVAENTAHDKLAEAVAIARKRFEALEQNLSATREARALRITQAKYPIAGLGFDDAGNVTFEGRPFAQASIAEKIRVSVAIGLALNPKLKILLIHRGESLDRKSLALVGQLAQDADAQVWIERVGDANVSVLIEDGAIKS